MATDYPVAVTLDFVPEELWPEVVFYINLSDYSFHSPDLEFADAGDANISEETEMHVEEENTLNITLEEICQKVAEHYNQENHTDDYALPNTLQQKYTSFFSNSTFFFGL